MCPALQDPGVAQSMIASARNNNDIRYSQHRKSIKEESANRTMEVVFSFNNTLSLGFINSWSSQRLKVWPHGQ